MPKSRIYILGSDERGFYIYAKEIIVNNSLSIEETILSYSWKGELQWRLSLSEFSIYLKPVIDPINNQIYFITSNGGLISIDTIQGIIKWNYTKSEYHKILGIDSDQHIIILIRNIYYKGVLDKGELIAFDSSNKSIIWKKTLHLNNNPIYPIKIKSYDNKIIVLGFDKKNRNYVLIGLNLKSGSLLWKYSLQKNYEISPQTRVMTTPNNRVITLLYRITPPNNNDLHGSISYKLVSINIPLQATKVIYWEIILLIIFIIVLGLVIILYKKSRKKYLSYLKIQYA